MDEVTLKVAVEPHILAALREDVTSEDVSGSALPDRSRRARVQLIAKEEGVIAGLDVFERVFMLLDQQASFERFACDGDEVVPGALIEIVEARVGVLLAGERTALNYLQRMSGIATKTRRAVRVLEQAGSSTKIVDTRKTTPGMRLFEKEAVRIGGGINHRFNLSDGVMLKDNHLDAAGGVLAAVAAVRAHAPFVRKIEVECESLEQVAEALEAGADIIMLDNMDDDAMREAVALVGDRAETECSGNVDEARLASIASIGVTYVSSGALTHSAGIIDLSMKHLEVLA